MIGYAPNAFDNNQTVFRKVYFQKKNKISENQFYSKLIYIMTFISGPFCISLLFILNIIIVAKLIKYKNNRRSLNVGNYRKKFYFIYYHLLFSKIKISNINLKKRI